MIRQCFACYSFHDDCLLDSDEEDMPGKQIIPSERTTRGQPAESKELEAKDMGRRQVKEQMFTCQLVDLQAQRIA